MKADTDRGDRVRTFFENCRLYLDKNVEIEVRKNLLKTTLADRFIGRAIDIGCGDGALSVPLLPRSDNITFLDFSSGMLGELASRLAASDFRDRAIVVDGLFEDSNLPEASYDTVLCMGVISHVQSVESFLDRVDALLAPHGLVVLQFSDAEKSIYAIQQALGRLNRQMHQHRTYTVNRIGFSQLANTTSALNWDVEAVLRYIPPLPGLGLLLPQRLLLALLRMTAKVPLLSRLGSECLILFRKIP